MKAFLSYGRNDAAFAATLATEIEKLGVSVWLDTKELAPGKDIGSALREAIGGADTLILVVPQTGASQANNAIFEAGAAKALGKSVLAVMPDTLGRELPVNIADFAVLDASHKPPAEVAKALVHALEPA